MEPARSEMRTDKPVRVALPIDTEPRVVWSHANDWTEEATDDGPTSAGRRPIERVAVPRVVAPRVVAPASKKEDKVIVLSFGGSWQR